MRRKAKKLLSLLLIAVISLTVIDPNVLYAADADAISVQETLEEGTEEPGNNETETPGNSETETLSDNETLNDSETLSGNETETSGDTETATSENSETETPENSEIETPGDSEIETPEDNETKTLEDSETETLEDNKTETLRNSVTEQTEDTDLDVTYNPKENLLTINWTGTNTDYVAIYLNNTELADKCRSDKFTYSCVLQPGASYVVSVDFYNNDKYVKTMEEAIDYGNFITPGTPKVRLTSTQSQNKNGSYTGFFKPSTEVEWTAQKAAVYEVYRATKDKQSSYNWIATVTSNADGKYVYQDQTIEPKTYYYKIRRKIQADDFVEQDLFTALSSSKKINASVPKAKIQIQQDEQNQIVLTLQADRDYVSGYDVYKKNSKGKYKIIATVSDNTFTDSDVEFAKTYSYKAKAFYYDISTGQKYYGKTSSVCKVKNTVGPLTADLKLLSQTKAKLSWLPASNAEGYEIYYKSDTKGDSYVLLASTAKTSYTVNLQKNKGYNFMIKAYKTDLKGKMYFSSAELNCKTGFEKPTGFKVSKTTFKWNATKKVLTQRDKLSWNKVYGASGYYIDRYDTATKKYVRVATVKKAKTTSYTVSNTVTANPATVKYRVSAYSKGKTKTCSDTVSVTPRMGVPSKVTAKNSGSKVKVSWNSVTAAEYYRVYRSSGHGMVLVSETKKTSITDKGLSAGISYNYYVQAVNKTLNFTGEMSQPTSYTLNPAKITGLKAENVAEGQVRLSWKAQPEAKTYAIYYTESLEDGFVKLTEVSAKKLAYVHKSCTKGKTYYYRITALHTNSAGILTESDYCEANVTVTR